MKINKISQNLTYNFIKIGLIALAALLIYKTGKLFGSFLHLLFN